MLYLPLCIVGNHGWEFVSHMRGKLHIDAIVSEGSVWKCQTVAELGVDCHVCFLCVQNHVRKVVSPDESLRLSPQVFFLMIDAYLG